LEEHPLGLTIKQVALILGVTADTVKDSIASGELPCERKGKHLFVPEEALQFFNGSNVPVCAEAKASSDDTSPDDHRRAKKASITRQLSVLEERILDILRFIEENRPLVDEIRLKDSEVARLAMEIEKLRREAVYNQRLFEKEMEDQRKTLAEKLEYMEIEASRRLALERENLETRLDMERTIWAERLDREKDSHERKLAEARRSEGLWARLIKMMTWS
jgi:excisionase family DNA binding protein